MYEVEKIVSSRINQKGKKEYQVKWVGYDHSENTWEPVKNLTSAKDILEEWNRREEAKEDGKQEIKKSFPKTQAKPQIVEKIISDSEFDEQNKNEIDESSAEVTGSATRQSINPTRKMNDALNKKGKPRAEDSQKDSVKILGAAEGDDKSLIFKIEVNGKPKWVERNYLIPNHMLELINFYEAAICFKN